jgi:hypothetical protein
MPTARLLALSILLAVASPSASFAGTQLVVDNDTDRLVPGAATTDRDYTQGVRLNHFGDVDAPPAWAARLPGFAGAARVRSGWSVGQEIYTPDAISRTDAIRDDRPYAGWLYTGRVLVAEGEFAARSVELDLGVVGPGSQARQAQTWWHRELGIRPPRGWDHQLANEPGVIMRWEERRRPWGRLAHADFVPHAGATLGNVTTQLAAGGTARLGTRLPDDFGPWRNAPGAAESDASRGLAASAFARAEGRWVARNLFLDGNTFGPGPRVSRLPFVLETQLGVEIHRGRFALGYVFSFTTNEFRQRRRTPEYGSVVFSF